MGVADMKINQFRRIVPIVILTGGLLMTPVAALEALNQADDRVNQTGNLEADRYLAVSDEEKSAWEALETEGPPPWSSARQKDTEGWFDGDRIGPPPWAASHQNKNKADQAIKAEQRQQWQESEKDGPPPWAAASRKEMPDN